MPVFTIRHITRYSYEQAARYSANQIILYPIKDQHQEVIRHELQITGDPVVYVHRDYFGNEVGTFTLIEPHHELLIDSKLTVKTRPRSKPEITQSNEEQWNELRSKASVLPYGDFLKTDHFNASDEIRKLIDERNPGQYNPYQLARAFCKEVYERFRYIKGITTVETTLDEIWKLKAGVCQDFAHMMLALLRMVNIPARYVSGYICPNQTGMRGEGATHAWVEAYLPFYGWLGFDPTNNCIANEKHVRLAVGRNFSDCSPVKGTYRGSAEHTLEVSVMVQYDEEQKTGEIPEPTVQQVLNNTTSDPQVQQSQQ